MCSLELPCLNKSHGSLSRHWDARVSIAHSQSASVNRRARFTITNTYPLPFRECCGTNKELLSPLLLLALATQVAFSSPLPLHYHHETRQAQRQMEIRFCFHRYRSTAAKTAAKAFHSCHCARRQWCTNTRPFSGCGCPACVS